MRMERLIAAFAVLVALSLGGPARAALVYVRYDGLAEINDGFGIFGAPGQVLSNAPISVVYALDPGDVLISTPISEQLRSVYADFTIRGRLFHVDNNDYPSSLYSVTNTNNGLTSSSMGFGGSDFGFSAQNQQGSTGSSDANLESFVSLASASIPRSIATPFSYNLKIGDSGSGSFNTAGGLVDYSCDPSSGLTCLGDFSFTYVISRIAASPTNPSVPLPATAPLFGAALLALGCANRARRRHIKPS